MLYFSVYYYAIIVSSHVCLWVLFLSSLSSDPLTNYTELRYLLHLFSETYSSEVLINKLLIWKKMRNSALGMREAKAEDTKGKINMSVEKMRH